MAATQRAERLRIDTRLAILENVKALSRQLDTALKGNQIESAKQIQENIRSLAKITCPICRLQALQYREHLTKAG